MRTSKRLTSPFRSFLALAMLSLGLVGTTMASSASSAAAAPLQPDLVVSRMQVDLYNPIAGEEVRTYIDTRNYGTGASDPITLTVTLSDHLQPTATSGGWNCSFTAPGLVCTYPQLAAGEWADRLIVTTVVTPGAAPGTLLPIAAAITPQRRESSTTNNSDALAVTMGGTFTVRGSAWHDLDRDGQRESGEPAVVGGPDGVIRASLAGHSGYGGGGVSVTFNPDGTYTMTGRSEVQYAVRVEASAAFRFTFPNVGDDATDSDIVTGLQMLPTLLGDSVEFPTKDGIEYVIDIGLMDAP